MYFNNVSTFNSGLIEFLCVKFSGKIRIICIFQRQFEVKRFLRRIYFRCYHLLDFQRTWKLYCKTSIITKRYFNKTLILHIIPVRCNNLCCGSRNRSLLAVCQIMNSCQTRRPCFDVQLTICCSINPISHFILWMGTERNCLRYFLRCTIL